MAILFYFFRKRGEIVEVLVDYLTFSNSAENLLWIIESLGLSDVKWTSMRGRYGWRDAIFYRGVTCYSGGRDDVGINLSGRGCRTVESCKPGFDWLGYLSYLLSAEQSGDGHVSRLDIAADDHDGILDMRKIYRYISTDRYICKAKFRTWTQGSEEHCYFGSPSSDRRVRIYNKALEQGRPEEHWIRAEMQMRDDAAVSFLLNLAQTREGIGETYAGVLLNFLRFVLEPVKGHNYDKAVIVRWWSQFLGTLRKCPNLYMPGDDYTLMNLYGFIERQASSSLRTWLQIHHGDMTDLLAMIEGARLNKRQRELLEKIEEENF